MNSLQELHRKYQELLRSHPQLIAVFTDAIKDALDDSGLSYDQISVRVKSWRSLRTKARKRRSSGELIYPDPWNNIHDIIGVRITTYHSTEIPQIVHALKDVFHIVKSIDKTAETKISGSFGYGSHHLHATAPILVGYEDFHFEIQIRTVLQHAWAEFEHDIRYKRPSGKLSPEVDRAFTLAAGLIELADQQFDKIAALEQPVETTDEQHEFTANTLPGIITMLQGTKIPPSRLESYSWIEELLHAHNITTIQQLRALVTDSNIARLQQAINYQFQPGHARILDDLLLAKFGQVHIEKTGENDSNPHRRRNRLRRRLELIEASLETPK
ncbi:GTP pyrophosphokinase family protein [Corynebacterium sp. HS2168-gen11]|uniref:GTP pyrophosphokinase family protein n=1 Tax=Corynebacterium sp. HS2168-gen11 TaxID=2974027 RepID=UPI0037BEACF2